MASRGRPNKYISHVQPKLEEIEKLCLTMTEKQIAEYLGVGYSSWCDYKTKYPELTEALKKGREALVHELKSSLIRKAKGFNYTEKKTIKEAMLVGSTFAICAPTRVVPNFDFFIFLFSKTTFPAMPTL